MTKKFKRILVLGRAFPHVSHNYINNDIDFLSQKATIMVLSPNQPLAPFYSPVGFNYFSRVKDLIIQAKEFNPELIVSWLSPNHYFARRAAEALQVPFILKFHTPDYHAFKNMKNRSLKQFLKGEEHETKISKGYSTIPSSVRLTARSPFLLGVFSLPSFVPFFANYFKAEKVRPMQPRIPVKNFLNKEPNGNRVLLLGSLLSRREGDDSFNEIIANLDRPVDWIPLNTPGFSALDVPADLRKKLFIRHYVPPQQMPALYKEYAAVVSVGGGKFSRGLSLSILEAQATGVAFIGPAIREDYNELVSAGGGYLFKEPSEIKECFKKIPENDNREQGFQNVMNYDISGLEEEYRSLGIHF